MSDAGDLLIEAVEDRLRRYAELGLIDDENITRLVPIVTLVIGEILFMAHDLDDDDDEGGEDKASPSPPSDLGGPKFIFSGDGDTWTFRRTNS
jgi:hypothetical protein